MHMPFLPTPDCYICPSMAAISAISEPCSAICQDLPLTEAGKPQLPATPATRQRVLLAALAAARCHYIW